MLTRLKAETGIDLQGILLGEFGFTAGSGEATLLPDLYLYGVSVEPAIDYHQDIEPLVSPQPACEAV